MNKLIFAGLVLAWGALLPVTYAQESEADGLKLNPVFGSHGVLQSGMPVPVWGTAKPGSQVTVSFAGQTVTAKAGTDGHWKVVLQPLAISSEPQKMIVQGDAKEMVLEDLLVGEVWLVCGRSNIGFLAGGMKDAEQEMQKAGQPLLRLLRVGAKDPAPAPLDDFPTKGWMEAAPKSAAGFSAVGWVFGSELQKALKVPVGIVMSSWGGSPPSMWIERAFFSAHKPGGGKIDDHIGTCFNSYIHPLIPMALKGTVIFFDGGPADEISLLAQNWRALWGAGDFPYIFIQVPGVGGPVVENPNVPGDSRSTYVPLLKTIPNSAMVVGLDCGVEGEKNIHPPNKRPIGERAALAARALGYGEKIVYSGPLFAGMKVEGAKAVLSFDHVGGGLRAKGGKLEGFAVTADGKTWSWGEAVIEGDHVVVTAPGLTTIKKVHYAWGDNPKGNLYNQEGLPASPFGAP